MGKHYNNREILTLKEYLKKYNGIHKKNETFEEFEVGTINFTDFFILLNKQDTLFPSADLTLNFDSGRLKTGITKNQAELLLLLFFRSYYNYNIKELSILSLRTENFNNIGRLNISSLYLGKCNLNYFKNLTKDLNCLRNIKKLSLVNNNGVLINNEEEARLMANTILNKIDTFIIAESIITLKVQHENEFFSNLTKNPEESPLEKLVLNTSNSIIIKSLLMLINSTRFKKLKSLYMLVKYHSYLNDLAKYWSVSELQAKVTLHNILEKNFPYYNKESFRIE